MTEKMPPLSRNTVETASAASPPGTASNPYFRMLTLLAAFLLALGTVLLVIGEVSTGGIMLVIGFSALVAVLITGAITWQIRQSQAPQVNGHGNS